MDGIVGFEISIDRIEGQVRLGQQNAPADRQRVHDALAAGTPRQTPGCQPHETPRHKDIKVSWFFSSEKNILSFSGSRAQLLYATAGVNVGHHRHHASRRIEKLGAAMGMAGIDEAGLVFVGKGDHRALHGVEIAAFAHGGVAPLMHLQNGRCGLI